MAFIREPTVRLISFNYFRKPDDLEEFSIWQTDEENDLQQLIEAAGRTCYSSWTNPSGRTNEQYIANLMSQGHLSVIEHAVASFYIRGISRAASHEIVRHRHFSFSQRSTRYVDESDCNFIVPDVIANDHQAIQIFSEATTKVQEAYRQLYELLREKFAYVEDKTLRRKLARQAARMILPNATETTMVMTGNLRAWRHFIKMRASEHADVEIRKVAIKVLRELQNLAPAVFGDFRVKKLDDQTEIAETDLVAE